MDALIWSHMFKMDLPMLEKILRTILVYTFLVIGLRVAGKRELAQLNPFDLVVLLTLSNTVQNAIIGNDNSLSGGLVGAATLLAVNAIVVRFLYRHERLEQLVEGAPDVLIENGEVRMERLQKELITLAELETAAHKQGLASLSEVERAILEPGGSVSFVARKPSTAASRFEQIQARLDDIARQVAALRPYTASSRS